MIGEISVTLNYHMTFLQRKDDNLCGEGVYMLYSVKTFKNPNFDYNLEKKNHKWVLYSVFTYLLLTCAKNFVSFFPVKQYRWRILFDK